MLEKVARDTRTPAKTGSAQNAETSGQGAGYLARAALRPDSMTSQMLAQSYREQVTTRSCQVETLKGALIKLERKARLSQSQARPADCAAQTGRSISPEGKSAHAQNLDATIPTASTF